MPVDGFSFLFICFAFSFFFKNIFYLDFTNELLIVILVLLLLSVKHLFKIIYKYGIFFTVCFCKIRRCCYYLFLMHLTSFNYVASGLGFSNFRLLFWLLACFFSFARHNSFIVMSLSSWLKCWFSIKLFFILQIVLLQCMCIAFLINKWTFDLFLFYFSALLCWC